MLADRKLTKDEVEARIQEGDLLVIRHGRVLKLNSWLDRHPGGVKAILHMVGRDGTDEMDVYHSEESLKSMNVYAVGTVDLPWAGFVPPIQGGRFRSREEIAASNMNRPQSTFPEETKILQEFPQSALDRNKDLSQAQADIIDKFVAEELAFDVEKYPKIEPLVQRLIQTKFRALHKELESEGWFQCNYWGYVREFSRIIFLFGLAAYLFHLRVQSLIYLALSAVAIGLAWHQLTFIAHDAGHLAITHNYYFDNLAGIFVADFIGGLSLGWWKQNHNVHHIVTNDPVHDPDIQHLPFFAVSSKLLGGVYSTYYEKVLTYDAAAQALLKLQHWLYYPILCFGRFNLYRLSWQYVLTGEGPRHGKAAFLRWVELIGLCVFTYWFFYLLCFRTLETAAERLTFILVSHVVTMPVHVQITLSHFAQSTSDLGIDESFAQRQVRTTMDVACPAWFDYIHGGLQFQTIHHLFPRMPRHNFRAIQPRVIEFCRELGLHYTIYGFTRGSRNVIDRLYDVANQAAVFSACQEFCRQELVGGGESQRLAKARQKVKQDKERAHKALHAARPVAAAY